MKNVLIVASKKDAIRFKKNPFKVDEVLSLNPAAEAELVSVDVKLINTLQKYPDSAHIQTANQIQQAVSEAAQHLQVAGHNQITIDRAKILVFYLISCGSFLRKVSEGYGQYFWYNKTQLKKSDSHKQAYLDLLRQNVAEHRLEREHMKLSFLHRYVLNRYNDSLLKKIYGRKKLLMNDGERAISEKFAKEVHKLDADYVFLNAKQPGKNIRATLKYIRRSKKNFAASEAEQVADLFCYVNPYSEKKAILKDVSADSFRQEVFDEFEKLIDRNINSSEVFITQAINMMQTLRPEIVTNDAINTAFAAASCKQAKEQGAQVVLFNHATNAPQGDKICKPLNNLLAAQGIVFSEYVTHNALRSPHIAALAKEVFGIDAEGAIYPLKHSDKIAKKEHEKFNIVFAGNYLPAKSHLPIIAETSDEFAATILKLAEVVSQIPDANLIIKLKKKKQECNDTSIEKLMPIYENVRIKSSSSFASELPECDLVIANFSTTIDEALESGTPVLLYSDNGRYKHLQGMTDAPTPENRAAVYTPKKNTDLKKYLQAIIAAHKNKPLQKSEYENYIWGDEADSMVSFAKKIIA